MTTVEKFDEWAVVEIMGHKKYAGHVTEHAMGGASFVRIDVPEITLQDGQKLAAFTKLFGAGSVYCISPCTEETAKAFAARLMAESFSRFEAPRLPAPKASEPDGPDAEIKQCLDCGCELDGASDLCSDCEDERDAEEDRSGF